MRRRSIVLIILALVIIWLLISAYIAGTGSEKATITPPIINIGIIPVIGSIHPGSFNLDDVNRELTVYQLDIRNESNEKYIFYILGKDVDDAGNATSWLYGIRYPLGPSLLLYDRAGWTSIPWNGVLPDQQIFPDTLYPLRSLFISNGDILAINPARAGPYQRQVEVVNGTYRITLSDSVETRILAFNMTTGALIPVHEE